MGRQREGGGSKEKPGKCVDIEARTAQRLRETGTGVGLIDWVFNAPNLVKDCMDEIEPESEPLQHMLEALYSAAQVLDKENWQRFQEMITERVHVTDQEVYGSLFAKHEPSWRPTLFTPKTKTGVVCVWLHLGTEPPSAALVDLLGKLGWFGVCVGPTAIPPGNEDTIEHVFLDPGHDRDREAYLGIMNADKDGKVPKPKEFPLIFLNTVFNVTDPEPDSDEEIGEHWWDEVQKKDDEREEIGEDAEDATRKKVAQKKDHLVLSANEQAIKSSSGSGYGVLGITKVPGVRRRLRSLNTTLSVALARLKDTGTLAIMWPGLPCHPVMFFLTAYLRNLFMRVHVIAPEGIKTFETYILCAGFMKDKSNDPTPGEGGSAIKSFFGCAYRRPALDDVLLWTLTAKAEWEEAFFGIGGRSKSKTYDELWEAMAVKYKALAVELDVDVTKASKRQRKEKKDGGAAKGKAKAGPKGKAAPKAGGKQGALPAVAKTKSSASSKKEEVSAAQTPSQSQAPSRRPSALAGLSEDGPSPPQRAQLGQKKLSGDASSAGEPPVQQDAVQGTVQENSMNSESAATGNLSATGDLDDTTGAFSATGGSVPGWLSQQSAATPSPPRRKPFRLTRSVPTLACSLGASPGSLGMTRNAPDRTVFASAHDFMNLGNLIAEKKVRRWHRKRDELGPSLSQDGLPRSASPLNDSIHL